MESSLQSAALSRLKFRVVQPVDIPRCYQLECLAHSTPEAAASKSTLQHRQHHAAPFFRCALLKADKGVIDRKEEVKLDRGASFDGSGSSGNGDKQHEPEACHHVHHSTQNQLIGYVCATRCHDVANTNQVEPSGDTDAEESSHKKVVSKPSPYPMKHEANGRYLAIRSLVVEKEFQRLGVAKSLLEYYIKSVEIHNAELDEAGVNRRRNKIKAKKSDAKIEKILLLTRSSMANLFLQIGFRWRATVENGRDPLYELERVIESSPLPSGPSSLSSGLQPHPLMEQDCFLVDVFADPKESGSGNPAAVIVLQDDPVKLIADYYSNTETDQLHLNSNGSKPRDVKTMDILLGAKAVHEEEEGVAEKRAEAWMQSVGKEFNQPATAFVWPIRENSLGRRHHQDSKLSLISDDDLSLVPNDESSKGQENQSTIHHFIRFYNRAGEEADMCVHATFASASVLLDLYTKADVSAEGLIISFQSKKDLVLQASLAFPALNEESNQSLSNPSPQVLPPDEHPPKLTRPTISDAACRVAINLPWRTVETVPPGPEGQGAVLAMLRRAFFRAWSVVEPNESDNDHETDELAFSLSASHVAFVGVTSEGEDLLIELSVEGFDMLSGKSVDYDALRQGWNSFTRGVIICCEAPETKPVSEDSLITHAESNGSSGEEITIDFRSRYFKPRLENEDPVSGWSHCALAPYFAARRGKQRVFGQQISDRGGLVECILNESEQQVCITGVAVTTVKGKTLMRA